MDTLDVRSLYLRRDYLPADLPEQNRWLPFRLVGRRKIPLDARGRACDPGDPQHWRSLSEASGPYYREEHRVAGLAFALDDSGYAVADFDRVVTESGEVAPEAQTWIDRFHSFSELSPSAGGVHVIVSATLPDGNRSIPGLQLLTSGIVTVTGHPVLRAPIRPGGAWWDALLRSLPPKRPTRRADQIEAIPVPSRAEVEVVLNAAMPNPRFRRLWEGDPTGYDSRSEADAALATHAARNGADLPVIVELLRSSALPRDLRRGDRYFTLTATLALTDVDVRVRHWLGVTVPASNDTEREAIARIEAASASPSDAVVLQRTAREMAVQIARGKADATGAVRVSPQAVAGDFPAQPGLPRPERIMSRRGLLKAWKRLAAAGVFELIPAKDTIVTQHRSRIGKVTLLRASGTDYGSILTGFADRLEGIPRPPLWMLLGTHFHNVGEDDA